MAIGHHLLLEIYNGISLDNKQFIENSLLHAAKSSNATILHHYFHSFGNTMGVTGIIALSESHISIHTWPEHKYAAIDIFMCGKCSIQNCANKIISLFKPEKYTQKIILRGDDKLQSSNTDIINI